MPSSYSSAAETPLSFSSFAEMAADLMTNHEAAKVTCKLKSAGKQQETISPVTICFGIPGASDNWH